MSFTGDTKNELCKIPVTRACCARSELYGILLFASVFDYREIRLRTDNSAFRKRFSLLTAKVFSISFEERLSDTTGKCSMLLREKDAIARVFEGFGHGEKSVALHLNRGIIDEECCGVSFLRGVFLTGGFVSDPSRSYHLELKTSHHSLSREVFTLLLDMGFSPKYLSRKSSFVLYLKDSSAIEDFLTAIGAPVAAMNVMEAKILKGFRNDVNRKVNCETANITKTVTASARQLSAIASLRNRGILDTLSDELKETARLREAYPEISLTELSQKFSPPLSKPGLSNRLRKLSKLAQAK